MRVIIHCNEYYPEMLASCYRMQVMADAFIAAGDKVTVITSSASKAAGKVEKGVRQERIIYSPAFRMKRKTTFTRFLNNFSFGITSIFLAIFAGKADVVITGSPPALINIPGWFIAKCKRAKLVYAVRDIWPDVGLEMESFSEKSFYCKVFRFIAQFMYKHADIITTVSPGKISKIKSYVDSLTKRPHKTKRAQELWFVGNGFDEGIVESEFDPDIVEKYDLDNKFTCVYIGNIGLAQGLGTLLKIATETKHKNIQFLCFGRGAEKEVLEQRAADGNLTNIEFCGPIDHSKVFSVISHAKITFVPLKSGKLKDSVPTKIFEALGIGCPVFLLAEGDSADIIDETNFGKHISPEGTDKVTETFDDMVDHYEELEPYQDQAVTLMFEKYSRQKISKKFVRDIHNYCGQPLPNNTEGSS